MTFPLLFPLRTCVLLFLIRRFNNPARPPMRCFSLSLCVCYRSSYCMACVTFITSLMTFYSISPRSSSMVIRFPHSMHLAPPCPPPILPHKSRYDNFFSLSFIAYSATLVIFLGFFVIMMVFPSPIYDIMDARFITIC